MHQKSLKSLFHTPLTLALQSLVNYLPVTVMQLDTEIGQYLRQHVPEVSPGRTRESEIDSTLSQEPSVNVGSHREGQQIEEVQGKQDLK